MGTGGTSIARKLNNWLKTFLDWTLPRSESPETFHFFAGLFAISSALRRNVYISKATLGSWDCYPFIYVMLVGPPGAVRKTTTMRFAQEILYEIKFLKPAPTIVTQAALLKRLVEQSDNAVYVFSKEFSDLIMKSEGEMYEFLTSMFDGDINYESETISRSVEFASSPCINLFAATTPGWITSNMPEEVINGGFASRCIFVYEDTPRFKKLYYHNIMNISKLNEMKQDLIDDLKHISGLKGEYTMTPETRDWMEDWYQKMKVPEGTKIASYFARKPTHVHKLAILLHAARSDTMVLELQDFQEAIYALDSIEAKMIGVFGGIGKNPHTADLKDIIEFVQQKQKVHREELLDAFKARAAPTMLESLIDMAIKMKKIMPKIEGDSIVYYAS